MSKEAKDNVYSGESFEYDRKNQIKFYLQES